MMDGSSSNTSEIESSGEAGVRGALSSANPTQVDPTAVRDEYSLYVNEVIRPSVPPGGGTLRSTGASAANAEEDQSGNSGSAGFIRTFVAEEYVADVESLSSNEGDTSQPTSGAHILHEKPLELEGEDEEPKEATVGLDRQKSVESEAENEHDVSAASVKSSSSSHEVEPPDLDSFGSNVFIISEAAKPVYMRHGPEDRLVPLAGVMQALAAFVQDGGDTLQTIEGDGGAVIAFYMPKHLTIVGVVRGHETAAQVRVRLTYMYNQLLTLISPVQLDTLYTRRVNYDLRRSLIGETRILTQLWDWMDGDIGHLLCAACCLPVAPTIRDQLSATLAHYCKKQKVLFGLVLAGLRLVTVVRHNRCPRLNPLDLQLLINLVRSSSQSGVTGAEFWVPVCLPRLDESAYVHAYVSHLDEASDLTLVLISADGNQFYSLCDCRRRIVDRLSGQGAALNELKKAATDGAVAASRVGMSELWHFTFKTRPLSQYTMTRFDAPFNNPDSRQQLMELYRRTNHLLHVDAGKAQPRSVVYLSTNSASCLGWLREQFELYAIFSPLVTKEAAVSMTSRLINWTKQEEAALFVVSTPTF